jgi:trigger factor
MSELQVSLESQQGLERKLRVQVPAARIDGEVSARLQKVGRTARIKGFRPGKVPAKIIRQHYGDQVRQEVLQEVLQTSYGEAISQQQLRPAGGPRIEPEQLEEGKDLAYTAVFEVYPEVELAALDKLKVEQPEVAVGDADVDGMLDNLRKQRAEWQTIDAGAADGHQLRVDFDGTLNGEPLEGGKGEDVPIVLGEGQMLPDFEMNLEGLKAGDEKTFELKFPKDYHAESLAGEKASFAVTVREVAEQQLPEVDEEFVRAFGIESGSVDDLRADIRRNMEREVTERVRAEVKRQVMEGLLEANEIPVPAVLIDEEAQRLREEAAKQLGEAAGEPPPLERFREAAGRRVRLGLLVGTVITEHEVEVDRDRVKAKVDEICAPYDQPEEIAKMYMQNPQLLSQVENVVLEEQVVDLLLDRAKIKSKKTSFDDLMQGS